MANLDERDVVISLICFVRIEEGTIDMQMIL